MFVLKRYDVQEVLMPRWQEAKERLMPFRGVEPDRRTEKTRYFISR